MDANPNQYPPPLTPTLRQPKPSVWERIKKVLMPVGVVGILILKWLAKIKLLILPILKFLPVFLKTGGTMFIMVWVYAMRWGWWFAFGFALLLLVHECGHLLVAKRLGLRVSAPIFIPFMGAFIALKDAPKNAWVEAQVGIGGPLLGTVGAVACLGLWALTGNDMFRGLAYLGFLLNLFNLAPIGFLDGGRIVTALSPWLWLVGTVVMGFLLITHFSFLLLLIFVFSLPRLFSLFRKKSDEERRYYEVTPEQRWIMGALYFGLIASLVLGMKLVQFQP